MRRPSVEPPRWSDGALGDADAVDWRAAELLKVPPPPPLGPVRRARIEARLANQQLPSLWWRGRRAWLVAGAAVALAAAAGGAIAAIGRLRARGDGGAVRAPSPVAGTTAAPAAHDPALGPARALALARPTVSSVAAAPPRIDATGPGPARRPSPPARPSVDSRVTSPPPAPTSEARLLADARARLQPGHDPAGALALLQEHRRRFPAGALVSEARVTEVAALLELGQRSDALVLLDGLALDQLPRGDDVRVLRGELRADVGRCREAIADFDRCADGGGCRAGTDERALFGRASCRARAGQHEAARADLESYLARFPRGRFAGAVRRALGGGAAVP